MKQLLNCVGLGCLIMTGCVSSTNYKQWSGEDEFLGSGGTVHKVGGIDIWENGQPSRKFRVLGIIDNVVVGDAGAMIVSSGYQDSRIVKEAKKRGGDGVILISSNVGSQQANNGVVMGKSKSVFVIKYLDEPGKTVNPDEAATQYEMGLTLELISPTNATKAVEWYERAAIQGHSEAQRLLGNAYLSGRGVAQDSSKGADWLKKSAEKHNATSQAQLAVLYILGEGVSRNFGEALILIKSSAEDQSPGGEFMYAVLNEHPDNDSWFLISKYYKVPSDEMAGDLRKFFTELKPIPQSSREAAKWYERSAQQGFSVAQFRLGLMFRDGNGVTKDYVEAYKWLNLAAAQGIEDAGIAREKLAERMTSEQVAQAQHRASTFVSKSKIQPQ